MEGARMANKGECKLRCRSSSLYAHCAPARSNPTNEFPSL